MHKIFRYPKFSETLKGCPRIFSAPWDQKFSTEKRDNPFSSMKLLETKSFLKNSRIPSRKFSALWDIKISTENRDKPPLIHKCFSMPENFRKTEGFFYKAFRFGPVRRKVPTKPWCPLLCMKIFDERIFLKHQSVLQWNFSVTWDKNFDGKSWYSPPPYPNFFDTRNYCNSKGFPYGIFRHCETKHSRQKILIVPPPLLSKLFWYPKLVKR